MSLALKIAWRNLWRHRGHSLVIGSILCLGALLMTVGNGVVSGMERGLRRTVVQGFTGDLVLVPAEHEGDNVFLEIMGKSLELIPNFQAIRPRLEQSPLVERFLPMGKNPAMVLNEDGGMPSFLYLLGVELEEYRRMFPDNVNLLEGRLPDPGGRWLLLPKGARKTFNDQSNIWFVPKGFPLDTSQLEPEDKARAGELNVRSEMVLMGFNAENASTDIRLDVDGIFRYKALNTIFGNFGLIDIESYRQAQGYFLASESDTAHVSARDSALFAGENLDALFGEGEMVAPSAGSGAAGRAPEVDWTRREVDRAADLDAGAYNVILILLRPGVAAEQAKAELNAMLSRESLGVRAVFWKDSLGPVGSMATLIKGALFVFVSILFLVAVIIIVNTLSMAALERTAEIGMMRAVGARKGFIGRMFLAETGALAAAFGGLGIGLGALTVEILAVFRLSSDNDMVQLFFGGDTFRPVLAAGDFGLAVLQLAFVTVAAVLYPLFVARSVTPLDAVYKE